MNWDDYLEQYHAAHAGITETALEQTRDTDSRTPYDWLAEAVPAVGAVLDLACGSAPMQPRLKVDRYLGVDRSAAELAAARRLGRGPLLQADATAVPVGDSTIDTSVMSMALMLLPQRPALAEVARVLRPGGVFAALVPGLWPLRAADLLPVLVVSAALAGPGQMPRTIARRSLREDASACGLLPGTFARRRFAFPVRTPADAALAVDSLYTPGRSAAARRRAIRWLATLPMPYELPVPLVRITLTKPG